MKDASDSESDESEKEGNAKQVNTPKKECRHFSWFLKCINCYTRRLVATYEHQCCDFTARLQCMQDYDKFNVFCNSLLGRTTKLADLCQQLESALDEAEKSPESSEGQRVAKSKAKFFQPTLLTSLGPISCKNKLPMLRSQVRAGS